MIVTSKISLPERTALLIYALNEILVLKGQCLNNKSSILSNLFFYCILHRLVRMAGSYHTFRASGYLPHRRDAMAGLQEEIQ